MPFAAAIRSSAFTTRTNCASSIWTARGEDNRLFLHFLDEKIKEAIALRRQITEMQAKTVENAQTQERLLCEADEKIERLKCAADLLIASEFTPGSAADKRGARDDAA